MSGDLDMTRMEWELLAFDISWEFDFCFCGGEGRHFLLSWEQRLCVLGWARGFYSFRPFIPSYFCGPRRCLLLPELRKSQDG